MKENLINILENLFHIYSPSGSEKFMSNFVSNYLKGCGWKIRRDSMGNITAIKSDRKSQPLLNAHMDTKQEISDKRQLYKVKYDAENDRFQLKDVQIGCDDKAGIAIIMYLAKYTALDFKILLTVQEEIGQRGVQIINEDFYKNTSFAFSLDRKNSSDIIAEYKDKKLCTHKFLNELINIGMEEGIDFREFRKDASNAGGIYSMADTYFISRYCNNSVNLSVGYYNPHGKDDYLIVSQAFNTLIFVKKCIEEEERLQKQNTGSILTD